MKLLAPALGPEDKLERAIPLEEALALAGADGEALEGYAFTGGLAAGAQLEKLEARGCLFRSCRFTGARLGRAYFRDCVFQGCDFSGARGMACTLRRCVLRGCKLSGANLAASGFEDVLFEDCLADGAVFSEGSFKNVRFSRTRLTAAEVADVKHRGPFAFAGCDLRGANFLRTSLNGQDLTACEIEGIALAGPELKGAKVTALQACELARLLGVIIE